jgi:hypothetical protein
VRISIPLLLGLALVPALLLGEALRRTGRANDFRQCSRALNDSIKLPTEWQIQSCKFGDWSGDFQAELRIPLKASERVSSEEFWRLNRTLKPDWTLTLDKSARRMDLLEVRLVGPK